MAGIKDKDFMESLEDWIIAHEPLPDILAMLCMASLLRNGLEEQVLDFAKKEIIESYGSDKLILINHLESCGFLIKKDKNNSKDNTSVFDKLKKSLALFQPAVDPQQAVLVDDPYISYTPLSTKLLELALKNGWNSQEMYSIPGPMETYGNLYTFATAGPSPLPRKTVLYYMVGGLTYSEVACLRKVAHKNNVDLVIATTDMISSKDFLKTFIGLS